MRYVFIVSHGMLAKGMHDAVKMLSGNESGEIQSIGLERDMGADEFADKFRELLKPEDYIGRCPRQVEAFLEELRPLLEGVEAGRTELEV